LVPKTIGQAKIAGGIIIIMKIPLQRWKVAIVLGEEKFGSALYSLPSSVGALNITMGYPSKTILPKF
jgi:hypothetical protein